MSSAQEVDFEPEFSPDILDGISERKGYNTGWVAMKVTGVKKKRSKDKPDLDVSPNWCALSLSLTPLSDPDDPDSTVGKGIFNWMNTPLRPPHWNAAIANGSLTEETVADWDGKLKTFLRIGRDELSAIMGGELVPGKPRKNEDGEYEYNGEEIAKDQWESCNNDSMERALGAFRDLWRDPDGLLDNVFYCRLVEEIDNKGQKRIVAKSFSEEHPFRDGQPVELLTGSDVMG